jgi:hypothetical protein
VAKKGVNGTRISFFVGWGIVHKMDFESTLSHTGTPQSFQCGASLRAQTRESSLVPLMFTKSWTPVSAPQKAPHWRDGTRVIWVYLSHSNAERVFERRHWNPVSMINCVQSPGETDLGLALSHTLSSVIPVRSESSSADTGIQLCRSRAYKVLDSSVAWLLHWRDGK